DIEQAERPDREPAGTAQRRARIETEPARLDERIIGKTAVTGQILHHERRVLRNHVTADGNGARRASFAREVFRQSELRFEPLPVAIDQRDKGHGHLKEIRHSPGGAIKTPLRPGDQPAKAERVFDRATRKLAKLFQVPMALVTLVDRDRQWFKSQFGLPEDLARERSTPRAVSICGHMIAQNATLVVEDLARDRRFANNPLIKARGFRFYAGAPLRGPGGFAIGSLCLLDMRPRKM